MSEEISDGTKEKLQQLQLAEASLQKSLMQKQQFQAQLTEMTSALEELKGKSKAYRIIGNIMVETDASKLADEIQKKLEILNVRIKSISRQEERIKEKTEALQQQVMREMGGKA